MYITHFGCINLKPLGHIRLHCDPNVNVFIGPNASGKSTLLRAIQTLYSSKQGYISAAHLAPSAYLETSEDWPRTDVNDIDSVQWDVVPLLCIPATRIHLPGRHVFEPTRKTMEALESDAPLKEMFDTNSGIFDGSYVELAIDWLRKIMSENRHSQYQFRRAVEIGYACSKEICAEIIYDDVPHSYTEIDAEASSIDVTNNAHYGMGVVTTDNIVGDPLYAGVLSSGTQGTLLWMWALALKMVNHHGWSEGWENKPAILLIDEIENHLHPTWQRRVIPALQKYFPGLQIFATTHSPFVVAGLKAGQVHMLKRDEHGRVTASTNTEDIVGWTMDEVLRNMMGVDDPTDDATAAAARELRQLRNEMPLADEEAEAQRQERMQELRKRVDRDLLAGGPMAAQRERFEEDLAKILEEHRKSRDLNQDNG